MRQEIIEQMRKICGGCNDFEQHDLKTLEKTEDIVPFFWCVSESKKFTHLNVISISTLYDAIEKNESFRYHVMRDGIEAVCSSVLWSAKNTHCTWYYYNGETLNEYHTLEVFRDICTPISLYLKKAIDSKYPDVRENMNKDIDIRFGYMVREKILEIAHTEEWQNLLKELKSFRYYARCATNHYVMVYWEGDKDFLFSDMVNGKCMMNGGIIYSPPCDGEAIGTWSKHT